MKFYKQKYNNSPIYILLLLTFVVLASCEGGSTGGGTKPPSLVDGIPGGPEDPNRGPDDDDDDSDKPLVITEVGSLFSCSKLPNSVGDDFTDRKVENIIDNKIYIPLNQGERIYLMELSIKRGKSAISISDDSEIQGKASSLRVDDDKDFSATFQAGRFRSGYKNYLMVTVSNIENETKDIIVTFNITDPKKGNTPVRTFTQTFKVVKNL